MKTNRKDLSIRIKIILTIFISTIFFASLLFYISESILTNNYLALENQTMQVNLNRVENSYKTTISDLDTKLADWSTWDDTYTFIKDHNNAYIESNLSSSVLSLLKINSIVYLDNNGEIVFNTLSGLNNYTGTTSDELVNYLKNNIKHFKFNVTQEFFSGVIPLKEGNLLFVSKPIIKSNGEGPVLGSMVFAKFINDDYVKKIELLTQLSLEIYPYNSATSSSDTSLAKKNISKDNKYFILPLTKQTIAGYFMIYDINNNPLSIFKINTSRSIFEQGVNTSNYLIIIIIMTVIISGLITLIFIETVFTRRILKLEKGIREITDTNNVSTRLEIDKYDEIGLLGLSVNNMLDNLYITQEHEKDSVKKEKIAIDELKKQIGEVSKLNKLMVNRELKMIELKEEINKQKTEANK